jgi:hypothetical protein
MLSPMSRSASTPSDNANCACWATCRATRLTRTTGDVDLERFVAPPRLLGDLRVEVLADFLVADFRVPALRVADLRVFAPPFAERPAPARFAIELDRRDDLEERLLAFFALRATVRFFAPDRPEALFEPADFRAEPDFLAAMRITLVEDVIAATCARNRHPVGA